MIGIGIDLCSIQRIDDFINKYDSFLNKYYTAAERAYLNSKGKFFADSAAGIFAAKEATIKALKSGIAQIPLSKISVNHMENGAPIIELYDEALLQFKLSGATKIHVSISHECDIATAIVLIE